jgi:hypothetical protein
VVLSVFLPSPIPLTFSRERLNSTSTGLLYDRVFGYFMYKPTICCLLQVE